MVLPKQLWVKKEIKNGKVIWLKTEQGKKGSELRWMIETKDSKGKSVFTEFVSDAWTRLPGIRSFITKSNFSQAAFKSFFAKSPKPGIVGNIDAGIIAGEESIRTSTEEIGKELQSIERFSTNAVENGMLLLPTIESHLQSRAIDIPTKENSLADDLLKVGFCLGQILACRKVWNEVKDSMEKAKTGTPPASYVPEIVQSPEEEATLYMERQRATTKYKNHPTVWVRDLENDAKENVRNWSSSTSPDAALRLRFWQKVLSLMATDAADIKKASDAKKTSDEEAKKVSQSAQDAQRKDDESKQYWTEGDGRWVILGIIGAVVVVGLVGYGVVRER